MLILWRIFAKVWAVKKARSALHSWQRRQTREKLQVILGVLIPRYFNVSRQWADCYRSSSFLWCSRWLTSYEIPSGHFWSSEAPRNFVESEISMLFFQCWQEHGLKSTKQDFKKLKNLKINVLVVPSQILHRSDTQHKDTEVNLCFEMCFSQVIFPYIPLHEAALFSLDMVWDNKNPTLIFYTVGSNISENYRQNVL